MRRNQQSQLLQQPWLEPGKRNFEVKPAPYYRTTRDNEIVVKNHAVAFINPRLDKPGRWQPPFPSLDVNILRPGRSALVPAQRSAKRSQ